MNSLISLFKDVSYLLIGTLLLNVNVNVKHVSVEDRPIQSCGGFMKDEI